MDRGDWQTPPEFYKRCHDAFGPFQFDAAAEFHNSKCDGYIEGNSFQAAWHKMPGCEGVWLNPPYSGLLSWAKKAVEESDQGLTICMLLPNDLDTKWFRLLASRAEIYITRGRIKFIDPDEPLRVSPRQGHIVAVLRPPVKGVTRPVGVVGWIDP
jgi:phage N-6-adenine-methyltransferase